MAERKKMPIEEFRDRGYLQEVNRRLLHPLGLAFELRQTVSDGPAEQIRAGAGTAEWLAWVVERAIDEGIVTEQDAAGALKALGEVDEIPGMQISGIWDERDDPEGIVFGDGDDGERARKRAFVDEEWERRTEERERRLGYMVQELP